MTSVQNNCVNNTQNNWREMTITPRTKKSNWVLRAGVSFPDEESKTQTAGAAPPRDAKWPAPSAGRGTPTGVSAARGVGPVGGWGGWVGWGGDTAGPPQGQLSSWKLSLRCPHEHPAPGPTAAHLQRSLGTRKWSRPPPSQPLASPGQRVQAPVSPGPHPPTCMNPQTGQMNRRISQ